MWIVCASVLGRARPSWQQSDPCPCIPQNPPPDGGTKGNEMTRRFKILQTIRHNAMADWIVACAADSGLVIPILDESQHARIRDCAANVISDATSRVARCDALVQRMVVRLRRTDLRAANDLCCRWPGVPRQINPVIF